MPRAAAEVASLSSLEGEIKSCRPSWKSGGRVTAAIVAAMLVSETVCSFDEGGRLAPPHRTNY